MNNDATALWWFLYLFVACAMLCIGLYITEKHEHNRRLKQRQDTWQTDFEHDWFYRGLYGNLLKHAELEARKLRHV